MRGLIVCLAFLTLAQPVAACGLALALAVDISGSVDADEYQIQMDGLAAGLRDGVVADALAAEEAQIALIQWTGESRQELSIAWTQIRSYEDAAALAADISETPRKWRSFSTTIGEALDFTTALFEEVSGCRRKVIDVSGDGRSNEGREPRSIHPLLREKGIVVNALVIEGTEKELTPYFWENVITGEGAFVVIANGYDEYPARMRQKLLREVTKQTSFKKIDPAVIPVANHRLSDL